MAALQRDFLPEHLQAEIQASGIDRVISVQARQNEAETDTLLAHAMAHDFIHGVVGWADLRSDTVSETLGRWKAQTPKFKGVRHVLQDEPDHLLMEDPAFNRGIAQLAGLSLRYDLLIFERHLERALSFVDRHPEVTFIMDHIAKPRIAQGELEPWASRMRELARRPHVFCKLSGMVTEADWKTWTPDQLRPYLETVLEAFGASRCMFGSDWPVCLAACRYAEWVKVVENFVQPLSPDERSAIWGGNALRVYG